ncbi:helix-turn-helix domain-containing protein [Paenibacillus gallinarum]|uniref:Helix-turn-helix transcriptional regulator n=1 Tax=Paenibacillus gallinarum TaxID=2762232 RepID=A0ABR8T6Y9_9BACL|nr:helix-turn-helix transcriptional regulator [Paenibacillus gallinarum]MBD7971385.1 helix-turn-helix transcriptional regulator [Paenibacillus gallinarum]
MERLPYNQLDSVDYRYIRQVRFLRNKTLKQFEEFMGVDHTVISRLENGQIEFSPLYKERFKEACRRLRVSNIELVSIRKLLEMKSQRGYK